MVQEKVGVVFATLFIGIFLAARMVEASQNEDSNQTQASQLENMDCDQQPFQQRPVLMAKRGYPDRLYAVELTYLKGFSTIHDVNEPFTIRIRCSANYDVAIDAHNLNLELNENVTSSDVSDFRLVDKEKVEPDLIDMGTQLRERFRVVKVVELTLFKKLGKYLVLCSSTECTGGKAKSALGINYSLETLRVFPVELSRDGETEEVLQRNRTIRVVFLTAAFIITTIGFGIAAAYVKRRRTVREMETQERHVNEIPLDQFRCSIIPESSTSFTSGFLGLSSSIDAGAGGAKGAQQDFHPRYM